MTMPFVSRERYDEKVERVRELERERELLLDRIAVLMGQAPLYAAVLATPLAAQQVTAVQPAVSDAEAEAERQPIRFARPRFGDLVQRAEHAVKEHKLGPVAVGVKHG